MLLINQFRKKHLIALLEGFSNTESPLDVFVAQYFRANKALGSKDRLWISDTVYGIIRRQGFLDYFLESPISWSKRVEAFFQYDPAKYLDDSSLPPHIRASFPKNFYEILVQGLGEKGAFSFCLNQNFPAPITIRSNPLKISREELLARWSPLYEVTPTKTSPLGIRFHRKYNFFLFEEFKLGFFEVQDEGSQIISQMIDAKPGDLVLDYCAGAGGKTLGFAHKLQGKGQIYLHDVRPRALQEAKKRLARGGIQNAQVLSHNGPQKNSLKGKMDWVLIDVPCSGSGTLRRNPDRKWKFSADELSHLVELQRTIFREALEFVKPGGRIVYATCSVLPQENERQLDFFLREFPLEKIGEPFQSFPKPEEMDGFFGAILRKSSQR